MIDIQEIKACIYNRQENVPTFQRIVSNARCDMPGIIQYYLDMECIQPMLDGHEMETWQATSPIGGLPVLFSAAALTLEAIEVDKCWVADIGSVRVEEKSMLGKIVDLKKAPTKAELLMCWGPVITVVDWAVKMSPKGQMEFLQILENYNLTTKSGVINDILNSRDKVSTEATEDIDFSTYIRRL